MSKRGIIRRLERSLKELYDTVRIVTDEKTAIDMGRRIKHNQKLYQSLTGHPYSPKIRRQYDW